MILCLGTTPTIQRTMAFERLKLDAVNRAADVRESASGKSINVALTLRTLGEEVLATGFLGGESGRFMRRQLDGAKISHEFIEVGPPTRTCVTVLDRATGVATELVEETKPAELRAYAELLKVVDANLWRCRVFVLSGSLPPGAPQDFYARCTQLARTAKVPVVLDGRGEPLRHALAEKPTVVKPNRHELAETVDIPVDTDEGLRSAIRELLARGPAWAVITDGPRDVIASDGTTFWRITPPKITPVNPIGSGDAFAAGMAFAITQGKGLEDACRLGAACGAANALSSPPGYLQIEDVSALLGRVIVTKME